LFGTLQIPDSARLRVAFSGGLDSSVLLHAVAQLRLSTQIIVSAIHIDHGLQPDSAMWAERSADTCRSLDIPFISRRVFVTGIRSNGLESAARQARYAALKTLLDSGEFLLTAHQRDDQAETVLLQLLRGGGIAGQAAIPARCRFGRGELLRPLLGYTRSALRAYADTNGLVWHEDPSNEDVRLRRNFLRAEILPRLALHWPDAATALARGANHAADALELLDEVAETDLEHCREGGQRYPWSLSVAAVGILSAARQRNLLRLWLRHQGIQAPGSRHFAGLLDQIRHLPHSRQSCVSWPGYRVWRYRDRLVVLPERSLPDLSTNTVWDMTQPLENRDIGLLKACPSRLPGTPRLRALTRVDVRNRQGGEMIRLPGRTHHHALKKLIQAAGIPPWERHHLPLLFAGDELVAVADRWVSADFAAAPDEPGFQIVWEPLHTVSGLQNWH